MESVSVHRGLAFHGLLIFFLSLVVGLLLPVFANPRMGLAAHVGGVTTGTFVMALAALWGLMASGGSIRNIAYPALIYGAYGSVAALIWSAATGASRLTPIAGAGFQGSSFAELIAAVLFVTSTLAMLVGAGLAVYALRSGDRS